MKDFKNEIVKALVAETKDCKIVALREIATKLGINHINQQDAMDVMQKAAKESGYRLVELAMHPHDSFFQSATLIEEGVEFEEAVQ